MNVCHKLAKSSISNVFLVGIFLPNRLCYILHRHTNREEKEKKVKSYNYIHILANWALWGFFPNHKRAYKEEISLKASMYRMNMS